MIAAGWIPCASTTMPLRLAVTPTGQRYLAELPLPPLPTLDAGSLDEAGLQARLTELQGDFRPCQRPHFGLGPPAQSLWKVSGRAIARRWRGSSRLPSPGDRCRLLAHSGRGSGPGEQGEPLPAKGSSYRQWGEGSRPMPNGKRISLASGWRRGKAARVTCWQQRAPPMAAPPPACCS